MSYTNSSASRIDSVAVDLVGDHWAAYMLSYHSKKILKTDITSLKSTGVHYRSRRHSSTAAKPQSMAPSQVIVSWSSQIFILSFILSFTYSELVHSRGSNLSRILASMLNFTPNMPTLLVIDAYSNTCVTCSGVTCITQNLLPMTGYTKTCIGWIRLLLLYTYWQWARTFMLLSLHLILCLLRLMINISLLNTLLLTHLSGTYVYSSYI